MKKMSRSLAMVLCCALLACCFTAYAGTASAETESADLSGKTLTIGLVSSLADTTGRLHQDVINLFIDKWNSEGTLYGATVKLVAYDNLNNGAQDTEMSIKSVQKLINSDHAQVIIPGQLSNIIQAVGDLINESETVGIGLGLAPTWMEQGWEYIYRTALNNNYQVPSVTATMKSLNQHNIAILYQNTDNCLTFRDSIKAAIKNDGLTVVAEEMLSDGGGTGITGQITSVINSNPDTVFITAMGGNFGTVIKQLRQSGYKGMIYIGQILTTTEVDSIGDAEVNGVIMCSPYVSYSNVEDCKNDDVKACLQEFYDKYVGINLDNLVSLVNAPAENKPMNKMYTVKFLGNVVEGEPVHYLNLPIDKLKEAVINQLKDGHPVWFGSDCIKFSGRKDGVFDRDSVKAEQLFNIEYTFTKGDRLMYGDSAMNHAMVILGVNINNEGKADRWRIENSWGKDAGLDGYYIASDSWFDEFVYQVVVDKKYLDKETLGLLDQPLIELEPWDPLGSLAD